MNQKRLSPLKTFLFYVSLFSLVFNFFSYPLYAALNHKYWVTDVPYFMVEDIRKAIESSQSHSITEHNIEEIDLLEEKIANSSPRKINNQSITKVKNIEVNNLSELARFEIFSKDKEGVIGYDESLNADDPADNIFSFEVDKTKTSDKEMYLVYEVYGIENASGVAKSINYGNSSGGYFVKTNSEWKVFKERISSSQLKNGENHVMFTVPEGKNIKYYIRNARFVAEGAEAGSLIDFSDANKLYVKDNKAYLHGTVSDVNLVLFINEQKIPMHNGSFEFIANNVTEIEELSIRMEDRAGEIVTAFNYPIDQIIEVDETVAYMSPFALHQIQLWDDAFYQFGLEDVDFIIHEADYDKADQIAVQPLRQTDIAPFGTSVRNVTAQKQAYRFTPDGAKFANPAQLILKYEKSLLPEGYTDHDISVMFFDIDERKWKAVSTDSIDVEKQLIYAKTTHFTDYIAGIIQAPESPETTSFTPTSISDIKIADPTANIVQIQPPSANQKGDGTVDFPIIVPPGRHGMQPNLALSYNNNGGSSFVGYGWDLSIPYITVDTKFGVPEYHSNKESESYILNGEELMLKNGNNYYLPHRTPAMVNRVNNASFAPKVEGSFSKIERIGNSPTSYYWIVTDKSGTKYYYGQSANSRFASSQGNIAKWMLEKIEDKHGNYVAYGYTTKTYSEGNLAGGKEILISSINYTFNDASPNFHDNFHSVHFIYDYNSRTDKNINYRYGFKEVNAALMEEIRVSTPKDYFVEKHYELRKNQQIHYELNHTIGKFGKTLLAEITTKHYSQLSCDCPNNPVEDEQIYNHTFEYYDDTQNGFFGPEITINAHDDFDFVKHSVIGSSKQEFEATGDVDFGVGVFSIAQPASYNPFSYSGTFNFNIPIPNKSKVQPSISLVDIDGDGLPDKLMKIGDGFKYRKNLGGMMFSQQLNDVIHFSEISSVTTRTSSKINPSISLFAYNVGWSNSKSVSESNIFLTDVNADGLVDYVKDKIVYFNRIDPNSGKPTFTDDSSLTPNRIIKENDVDNNVLAPLPDLRLENDLMDVVKVWVAPKDGKVAITGTISKQFVSSDDGIRFSVEHSSTPDYIISPSLLVVNSMSTNKSNINVSQGDMLFFRVNSSQLPAEDAINVSWNPKVTYTTQNFDSPNQYKQYSSQYHESYIYGNNIISEPYIFKESGAYIIGWENFTINNSATYPELTDDVKIKLKVFRYTSSNNNPEQVLHESEHTIKRGIHNNVSDPFINMAFPDIQENNPSSYIFLKVDVETSSQIDWKKLDNKFKPHVIKLNTGNYTYVTPEYQTFSGQLTDYYKSTFVSGDQIKINHLFNLGTMCGGDECQPVPVYLVVKDKYGKIPNTTNGRPAKFMYQVGPSGEMIMASQYNGNEFQVLHFTLNAYPFWPIPWFGGIYNPNSYITVNAGQELYFEYYTESKKLAHAIDDYQNQHDLLTTQNGLLPKSDYISGQSNTGLYKANVFYNENLLGIGTMYRNWGQFIFKGAMPGENFMPINKAYVGLDKQGNFTGEEGVSQAELDGQADLFANTDPDDLDYDFDTGNFSSDGSTNPTITPDQVNAIKNFAILQPDRNTQRWLAHNKLYVGESSMSIYYRLEEIGGMLPIHIPDPQGISSSGAVSIVKQSVSHSKGRNVTAGFGFLSIGASETEGSTKVFNDYQDVNGDGYPDVIGEKIQLTSFRGGLSDKVWTQSLLFDANTSGTGQSLGGSNNTFFYDVLTGALNIKLGDVRSGSVSIGGNGLTTNTISEGVLMDINGDGLADKVLENGTILFNTGNGFVNSNFSGYSYVSNAQTKLGGLNGNIGNGSAYDPGSYDESMNQNMVSDQVEAFSNFDLSAGFAGSRSSTVVQNEFMDINGDGLIDYISGNQVYFNTGTNFLSGGNIPKRSESNVAQLGLTVNASFNLLITIPFIPLIGIKIGLGGGFGFTNTYTQEITKYMDFDGDGYIDMLHSTNENNLKVRYSTIGRTNMLKNIKNPTGSQIIMDYGTKNPITQTTVGNNYKMPFKKWVLTKVRVHDGFESDGENVQSFSFEYFNGLKDRRERKFLGFGEVHSHQLRADEAVYRTSIKEYMLNTMPTEEVYLAGIQSNSRIYQYIGNLLIKETIKDGANRIFGINEYDYAIYTLGTNANNNFNTAVSPQVIYGDMSRILPLIKENTATQRHYQGNSTTDYIVNENVFQFLEYDKYGNVTKYRVDHENINVEIDYHYINSGGYYIVNMPHRHNVSEGSTTLRMSETELSPQFNVSKIHRIKTLENAGQMATTDFKYDNIGNLTMVVFPKPTPSSSESERFFYKYEYDTNHYQQYVNKVTDAYGFESYTLYNNFGLPYVQIDANEQIFFFEYDSMRRLKQFKGPYNEKWTIRNEYKTAPNGLRYAVTAHNITDEIGLGGNVQEVDYQLLHTSTFADGLGRIIQTKKQLDVYQECENATDTTGYRFAVSGKVVYDEFGRAVESYLGQEQLNCNGDFVPALESYEPLQHVEQERTSNFYDSQHRIIQNHVHGLNATTMFEYGYGDDGISQNPTYSETVILPEGNITQTYKDYKGRTTASHQIGDGETLRTTFEYDVLSQLTKVTDAENKQTQYQYDSFGNKIEVNHPDNGISQFKYDLTGKLSESRNQNLINDNVSIQYKYNFNQLTDISYPTHSVHYKYGNGSLPNDKGRLVRLQDLTGVRSFQYGALGEVIQDQRLLMTENDAFEFNQVFRFDSWGRIMEQTYPDGEELIYQYNSVGQLKSIANTDQQAPQVYLKDVKYNFFDQPTEILYGNDVKTTNEYDITQRIRAMQLDRPDETTFMRNVYSYDTNQNITQVRNMSSQHDVLHMGGVYNKHFQYDDFNRLAGANISWHGFKEDHQYHMGMKYNKTHGIVMKGQTHERNNNHTVNSYDADYLYDDSNHPHAPSSIKYSMHAGGSGDLSFRYDANGNIIDLNANGAAQNLFMMNERQMFWDEQNRLLAVIDDGNRVSHYIYDHAGERTFKAFGDVTEINIGGANIYKVLDIHKYTMYPSGNMVVNIDRKEATKHYYINEKRFASRIIPIDEWIKPGTTQGIMTDRDYVDMSMILDNTDIDSEENISYAAMSIGNPDSNCTAQLQVILQNYENHPHRQHCWAVISHMAESMSPCDALVAANEYVCVDTDPVTGEPIDEESNTPVVNEPETPQPPETMDCITELTLLINDYSNAQTEWEEEQFGGLSIGLFSNNNVYSVGACCPVNELCVEQYWEIIEQFKYLYCQTYGNSTVCEGLPEDMDIQEEVMILYYQNERCLSVYFSRTGGYEQGLEPDCYPMDCNRHLWSCEVVTGGEGTQNPNYPEFEDEDPPETIYPDSCYGEVLEYIDTNLLADFSNACEVYYYVIQNFDCLPDPWVPEDPGTPEVTPDPWVGGNPNNNPPEEPPYDESQRMPIWWYHSDHLGSSSYITDNFGRPSHYYEYLPFGELMTEHNQSKYYIDPYPTQNMDSYNNPYKFNGKEMDRETGMYYYGARYYDPRISIFVSVDPLAEKYPNYTPYNYTLNNPINLIDPDGREPIKPYVGTVGNFVSLLNNSPSKVGAYTGTKAHNYMLSLGNTKWNWKQMRPLPTQTGYFNMKKGRYIYTTKGGWVDMTHFMFYAGKAYKYKEDGISNPIGNAVQDGYAQEASDVFVAGHSAYSYEDLPSDYYGADFAVNHFDPNSKETFAEQLGNYLINELGATNPEDAPNYENLPTSDNRKTPTRQNKTTRPLYIEGDKGNKVIDKEQLPGGKKIGEL